jgi:ABC-type nitrate/sulfonate/bicarbonate transport system substrate-binding protein
MVLASTMKLTGPQDLAGKRIGVHSEASLTKALAQYYLEKNSIDDAKLLIVPGSDVRVQALSKDQLDAAVVSLTDYATLEEQYAGKFHTLVDFSKELPDLMAFTVTASDKWVDENPELAQTFVTALVNGFKKVSTLDEAMKYANEHYADFAATPELLETQVKLLVDGGYFPADGQLTPEVCKGSIQFLTDVGQIEGLTTVEPDKYCRYDVIDAARSGQ